MKPPAALRFSVALSLKRAGASCSAQDHWDLDLFMNLSLVQREQTDVTTGLRGCQSGLEAGRSPFKSLTGSDGEETTANDGKKERKKRRKDLVKFTPGWGGGKV